MPYSCDRKGMWDHRVSIGQTSNANSGLSILEPLMELIIEHCIGKCNHSISNEMVSNLFKRLSISESQSLDCPFTLEEIKEAMWDCGSAKAPGSDVEALNIAFLEATNNNIFHEAGEGDRVLPNNKIKSEGNWDGSKYQDTADRRKRKEVKAFIFLRMETEEVCEWYITPCFVEGLDAYDGITYLEYEKNMISNEFTVNLRFPYELRKNSERVVSCEVLVALKGELYFISFIINPKEDDIEPGMIFRHSFLRLTKGIVDFGSGILTIYPDLITFNNNELDALLASIDVDDLPPLDITNIAPFLKLDGEFEVEEEIVGEEFIKGYKAIRKKNDPRVTTSTFDGLVHQKFNVANVRNARAESDSDDDEEYCLKRDDMGKPIYGPNNAKYLSCDDPIDRALAL
ncbi:hypothetical protein Tco_0543851 [Tanacetum coccineum]